MHPEIFFAKKTEILALFCMKCISKFELHEPQRQKHIIMLLQSLDNPEHTKSARAGVWKGILALCKLIWYWRISQGQSENYKGVNSKVSNFAFRVNWVCWFQKS